MTAVHLVPLSIPQLRAAIRALADTADEAPGALLADDWAPPPHLTENEVGAARVLVATYLQACATERVSPRDGWLDGAAT